MKNICLYFQVHQPFRYRTYRFFDIGHDHYYYDDFSNRSILQKIAKKCYLPTNKIILELLEKYKGEFKVTFSITGTVLEQMELYTPETLKSFQELAQTGHVEFLAETYSHSLVSLKNEDEFRSQVKKHGEIIKRLFNQEPKVFRNTELIYSDKIGEQVYNMGYKAILTEGAKHILGWKSPNYLYCNSINPRLKVFLRNFKLSDDIAFRFGNQAWSEWPLTAGKFTTWLQAIEKKEEVINLFMDYETFGEHQWEGSGIFEFLKALPGEILKQKQFRFSTPSV
ncbi:MAG: glycoside hydrolase family 57 protein, partial [Bacteroidales bacterium]